MTVRFDIPGSLEQTLRNRVGGDLDDAAKQAFLISLFREGTLSHYELAQALSMDRFETDAMLKRHRVTEGSLTWDDVEADRATLARVLGPVTRK